MTIESTVAEIFESLAAAVAASRLERPACHHANMAQACGADFAECDDCGALLVPIAP